MSTGGRTEESASRYDCLHFMNYRTERIKAPPSLPVSKYPIVTST